MHYIDVYKTHNKSLDRNYTRILRTVLKKTLDAKPYETMFVRPPTSNLINHPSKTNKMQGTVGEAKTKS